MQCNNNKSQFFNSMLLSFVSLAKPSNNNITIGDDKANWEALYKESNGSSGADVGRSDNDENIFDRILRINVMERGLDNWI